MISTRSRRRAKKKRECIDLDDSQHPALTYSETQMSFDIFDDQFDDDNDNDNDDAMDLDDIGIDLEMNESQQDQQEKEKSKSISFDANGADIAFQKSGMFLFLYYVF